MDFAPFRIDLTDATLVGHRRPGNAAHAPLVLIHGFGGSRHDWAAIVSALPGDIPIIAIDQRGFGESTGTPGTPFSHADDLIALLDHLDIEKANLCGLSLGGGTVLNAALNVPDRVGRLVMVSPMMIGWSWSEEWIALWKAIGRAARSGDMAAARQLWWQHPLFAPTRAGSAASQLRAGIEAFHGAQWVQDDQRPELPDVDRLSCLQVPALLLTGALDLPDFRLMADLIAAAAPQVTRIDHDGAGHLLNLEIPGLVAQEIAAFLG